MNLAGRVTQCEAVASREEGATEWRAPLVALLDVGEELAPEVCEQADRESRLVIVFATVPGGFAGRRYLAEQAGELTPEQDAAWRAEALGHGQEYPEAQPCAT